MQCCIPGFSRPGSALASLAPPRPFRVSQGATGIKPLSWMLSELRSQGLVAGQCQGFCFPPFSPALHLKQLAHAMASLCLFTQCTPCM